MCGVAGFWGVGGGLRGPEETLHRMARVMAHRGPDGEGVWYDPTAGVGLAHRRLAVLDLSAAGAQPMISANGQHVLVLNGEIYNHRELRTGVGGESRSFRGHSDTEAFLEAIAQWGVVEATRRAIGMFAFAHWDRGTRTLSLGRDRLGEKPLYVGWQGDTLLFGSELTALREHPRWAARIDRAALQSYMALSYVPSPASIFEGIRKVTPGTILSFHDPSPGDVGLETRYWDPMELLCAEQANGRDLESLTTELEDVLQAAVASQTYADVPVGAFLSGGIDSSLIVALMQRQSTQRVRTFTIGFTDRAYDEAPWARSVASLLGTQHSEVYLSTSDLLEHAPGIPQRYDEPFADSSQIPTALVASVARREVTVSLSGDGGDELFGGYDRYLLWNRIRRTPPALRRVASAGIGRIPEGAWRTFSRLVAAGAAPSRGRRLLADRARKFAGLLGAGSVEDYHWAISSAFRGDRLGESDTARWRVPDEGRHLPHALGDSERMMFLDLLHYLPDDLLTKVDRATMAVGLESRAPFLDYRVVEAAWRIPFNYRIHDGQGKWILRRLLGRHLPSELIDRPKQGFCVPLDAWLRGPLRGWAGDLLFPTLVERDTPLDGGMLQRVWHEHQTGDRNWSHLIWNAVVFEAWRAAR
ncbi:MAG: asparagine synthase (glutamine-hydrolyzing) [Gemmatimonadaceae bacterium]